MNEDKCPICNMPIKSIYDCLREESSWFCGSCGWNDLYENDGYGD